ncbi:hypothetical protein [Helicobacter pullorum]|nr:hypothetical protein [Helicobacter pullorum]
MEKIVFYRGLKATYSSRYYSVFEGLIWSRQGLNARPIDTFLGVKC